MRLPYINEKLAKLIADNCTATEVANMAEYLDEFDIHNICIDALNLKAKTPEIQSTRPFGKGCVYLYVGDGFSILTRCTRRDNPNQEYGNCNLENCPLKKGTVES